jgi:hypothetical protein
VKGTFLIICFAALALFFSCSKDDEKLSDTYVLDKIMFFNTSLDDLKYITIVGYEQGSNLSTVIDSTYYVLEFEEIENPYYNYYGYLNKDLRTDLDYKISFLSLGLICEITEIKVKKYGSFIGGYRRSFDGYKMNGLDFACQIIKVFPE